jgi:hypothetical protein
VAEVPATPFAVKPTFAVPQLPPESVSTICPSLMLTVYAAEAA